MSAGRARRRRVRRRPRRDTRGPAGPPGGSPPGLDKAIAAKEKHAQRLLDKPGIAGIGVGLNPAGKPVIRIYKEKPDVADVPDALEGVAVESVDHRGHPARAPTDRFPTPGSDRRLGRASSGSPPGRSERASRTATNVYALSNNHVFAGVNTASIGDPILQPGPIEDGGATRPTASARSPTSRRSTSAAARTRWTPRSR